MNMSAQPGNDKDQGQEEMPQTSPEESSLGLPLESKAVSTFDYQQPQEQANKSSFSGMTVLSI